MRIWDSVLPEVVVVGAMKAGTTTLVDAIDQLDGFTSGRIKEPSIFALGRSASALRVRSVLNYGFTRRIRIDGTTEYSKLPASSDYADAVFGSAPNPRIIFLVRHPVDRALSHVRHDLDRDRTYVREALPPDPRSVYVQHSQYREMIRPWVIRKPDNVCVLIAEKLFAGDTGEIDRLRQFLNLSPATKLSFGSLNVGGKGRDVRLANSFSARIPGYRAILRPLVPSAVRRAAVNRLARPLSRESRALLEEVETYRPEFTRLLADEISWYRDGCRLGEGVGQ